MIQSRPLVPEALVPLGFSWRSTLREELLHTQADTAGMDACDLFPLLLSLNMHTSWSRREVSASARFEFV